MTVHTVAVRPQISYNHLSSQKALEGLGIRLEEVYFAGRATIKMIRSTTVPHKKKSGTRD